jgi:tetratricopeptide (TPR) repeat protein
VNDLEEERDFLLRSLDDLEREHDAGDVDDVDYEALRDDYTARAASVIRRIEADQEPAAPPAISRRWGRTLAWVAGIAVFAVLAGVLVARMSGSRRDGETATGDVRENTRQLVADAFTAFQSGEYADAIDLYSQALDLAPSNAEALAYRGWARFQQGGDDEAAAGDLDAAIAADGEFPDARVFRAIMFVRAGDHAAARQQLDVFDSLDPPAFMQQILERYAVREHVVAGILLAEGAPTFTEAAFTPAQVLEAAFATAEVDAKPLDAITLLDMVLAADPNNADAHAYKGYTLARVGIPAAATDVTDRGLAEIDAALVIDPQHAPALAYRAMTLMFGYDDAAGAKAALDDFDALVEQPEDLVAILESSGVRDAVSDALGP